MPSTHPTEGATVAHLSAAATAKFDAGTGACVLLYGFEVVLPELTLGADWDRVGFPPCRGGRARKGESRREVERDRER